MNGIHDPGGMHGFGPLVIDENEPTFHAEWERRIAGIMMTAAFNGLSVFDENRRAAEEMPLLDYLQTPYYGRWLHMIETMVLEKRVATREELTAGHSAPGSPAWSPGGITPEQVPSLFRGGGSARAAVDAKPRFAVGDAVTTRNVNPSGHTRLPRYARSRTGVIERHHGGFVFPDTRAHGLGDYPQHLYSVRFPARELWGEAASERDAVYLDLWDSYLE